MASEASLSDSVDPLRGISGPLLFPRTIRPSADVPVPVDPKDLDSIHNFMKSLELRSPEKLMNEAKRIVDGGAEFLESKLGNFAKNVGIADANAAKGKDVPQERRPGLRLDRKRAKFSLKTSVRCQKEIQKQLGGSIDNVNLYEPLNTARSRRPGILGKSYNYKHRYSSEPSENDILMASQNAVDQDIPSAPEGELQEKLVHPDPDPHPNPNPDPDLEEVEPAESGTSFETGVRRSKRIRSRPLEYWKGERFLYGRVDNSLKLIGVKYLSPGKDTDNMKVKPYIASQSSDYQELLELAARH
ncbi:UNVERIFIED_CONTAM: Centromere protein C [Sesamum angustifolium]|uniref:Centromere protein C n=1 Tax=Sesamum angustifolium TaxID=2727405 RepID=A0AAW2LKL0_9LAMI